MRRFARLFTAIDETTRTSEKVDAMVEYFRDADPADAAWVVYFLSGGRPKRLIPVRRLAAWTMEEADVPAWLFEESYEAVGDLAETMSLLLPDATGGEERSLAAWMDGAGLLLLNLVSRVRHHLSTNVLSNTSPRFHDGRRGRAAEARVEL